MPAETTSSRWTAQLYGLMLLAVTFLAAVILTFVLFDGEDSGMTIGLAVLTGGATAAVWRSAAKWATALGLLATLGSLAMFFFAFGISAVFSPIDFIFGLTFLLGFLLSLVGGIRALARRKASEAKAPTGRLAQVVTAVVALGVVVSVGGFFATKTTVGEAEAAGATPLAMEGFEFQPGISTVAKDSTLLVRNSDAFAHDFKLDELDVLVFLNPGSEALVDLNGLAPGTYVYNCSLHSDGTEGMVGTLVVEG